MTPRLLSDKEAAEYMGIGLTMFRTIAPRLPRLRAGRRVLYDRFALDQYINQFSAGADISLDKINAAR